MARVIAKIDLEAAGGQNNLSLEFSRNLPRGIPPYLPGWTGDPGMWKERAERVEASSHGEDRGGWEEVVEEIASLSLRLGTREDVIARLRRGRSPGRGCFFVVTGQQPGALGGALLGLYKVLTAVALAKALEEITRLPFVPLYWCGADDSDFEEVRGVTLLTRSLTPISAWIAQQAYRPGLPVGAIAGQWIDQVWRNLRPFVDEFDGGEFAAHAVEGAFRDSRDHGEHAAGVLVRLSGGAVAVVDGRSPAVRRCARTLIAGYVRDEDEIKRVIVEEGLRLERSGYHSQVTPGDDSGIFLMEDGVRKNVTREKRHVLVEAVRSRVEECSPGVVARNLVQDAAIQPVAVVLGPAEIAYRAQIAALYPRFGIAMPAPVPRLTATFLPPSIADLVEAKGAGAVAPLLHDPGEFARSMFDGALPAAVGEAARELERRVTEASEAYLRAVEESAPPKAASRAKARIADLKNRSALATAAAEIGKSIALDKWPFLADLASVVKPAGKPQERTLSALTPFLFGGARVADDLRDIAAGYVDDLLDGRASHAVYSSTA